MTLIDNLGAEHLIWLGNDPTSPESASDFILRFPETGYDVAAVKITIDTDHAPDEYEEIDAVRLLTGGTFASLSVSSRADDIGTWTNTEYNSLGQVVACRAIAPNSRRN